MDSNDVGLPPLYEWQRQAHELINTAFREGKRLMMLNCGRRSGKSDCLAKWAVTWERGLLAGGRIGWCAPSSSHYAEVKSWIRNWLGSLITGPSPAGDGYDFITGGRISFFSIGTGAIAPMRGHEFQAVICDEAAHVRSGLIAMMEANIAPCLALSGGPIVCASTPRGIANDYYELWLRAGREGARMSGPSTMNPNFSQAELESERKRRPPMVFAQEYEAQFVHQVNAALQKSETRVGRPPAREEFETISIGIDLALGVLDRHDYSAVTIAGVDRFQRTWILFGTHFRLRWPETLTKVLGYIQGWRANLVCCEQIAFQELAVRQLSAAGAPLIPVKTSRGKEERFDVIHTLYSQGEIWWSESLATDFTNELFSFPFGHDDQMDSHCFAIAGLYKWIRDAWVEPGSLGRAMGTFDNSLAHERKAAQLRNADGSYAKYVVREADAEPELVQYNKDGTEKVDDGRRIEKVGDAAVLFDADGNELERCDWNAHVWGTCAAWAAAHPKPCD